MLWGSYPPIDSGIKHGEWKLLEIDCYRDQSVFPPVGDIMSCFSDFQGLSFDIIILFQVLCFPYSYKFSSNYRKIFLTAYI